MYRKMEMVFCAHETDALGILALDILKDLECKTLVVHNGNKVPEEGLVIAIFQVSNKKDVNWPSKAIRMSAHLLVDIAPEWASDTPFVVGIRPNIGEERMKMSLRPAMKALARGYAKWLYQEHELPWGNYLPVGETRKSSFSAWLEKTEQIPRGKENWEVPDSLLIRERRRSKKKKAHGKGWKTETQSKRQDYTLILPAQPELEKEAAFVNLLGAFNYDVCMTMASEKLHTVFLELRKRLALVSEAAATGGGMKLFSLFASLTKEQLLKRESVMPLFEALLLYGRQYSQLSDRERCIADQYQTADEQSHFSRIMDVGALRQQVKHLVGFADAGNPFVVRTLMNTARYREDLGIKSYYPLPYRQIPEAAKYKDPLAPYQVRANDPYIGCVISAGNTILAHDLMEIYRKLITQYPLEITFLLMEEWLANMRIADSQVSFTAVQVRRTEDNEYEAKLLNVGGGATAVCRSTDDLSFDYENQPVAIGSLDSQIPHRVQVIKVEEQDVIFTFPKTHKMGADINFGKLNRAEEVSMKINPRRIKYSAPFEWTSSNIVSGLSELTTQIGEIRPKRVEIEFGHTHGDREPGADQILGAFITGVFANQLRKAGIDNILTRPVSDNYHVVDRLNFPNWVALLEKHSGLKITEVNFEDALISRHLGDELIALLHREQPHNIVVKGGNYYFSPPDSDLVVELYDGVTNPNIPGRMGCVPFQIGYELYRLNPEWTNQAYQEYIFTNFPHSLVAKWWRKELNLTYQELMLEKVYMLPCSERMALKTQLDREIDRPYSLKCLSGETIFLDELLETVDIDKVVLLHFLENFYDTQERKSTALWQALGLPHIHQWRISFNRFTGQISILDWNRPLKNL